MDYMSKTIRMEDQLSPNKIDILSYSNNILLEEHYSTKQAKVFQKLYLQDLTLHMDPFQTLLNMLLKLLDK